MKTTGISHRVIVLLALAFFALGPAAIAINSAPANAGRTVPDAVKVACSTDYKRYCSRYQIGSSSLNACMRSNGKRLSRVCLRALVDHKMVPRRFLRAARKRAY